VTQRYGSTGWWWNATTTPRYGDIAAYRDERSDYIYIWGGPPTMYINDLVNASYVYQARVLAADAFDLSKYEYWWGRQMGWRSDVLTQFGAETAVLWGSGQGQVVWSPYYQTYMFVTVGLGRCLVSLLSHIFVDTGGNHRRYGLSPHGPVTRRSMDATGGGVQRDSHRRRLGVCRRGTSVSR
jgi:hypothetical protein